MAEYKKTQFGYLIKFRSIVGRLEKICHEWCRAFDAGDREAIEHLGLLLSEDIKVLGKVAELIDKTPKS